MSLFSLPIWPVVAESGRSHVPRRYLSPLSLPISVNPEPPPLENTSRWQTRYERAALLYRVKAYAVRQKPGQSRGTVFAPLRKHCQNEHRHVRSLSSPHALDSALPAPAPLIRPASRVASSPAFSLLLWHTSSSDISAIPQRRCPRYYWGTLSYLARAQSFRYKSFYSVHLPVGARIVDEWAHAHAL